MGLFVDLTGKKFGKWTAIRRGPKVRSGDSVRWVCRCACGFEKLVASRDLRNNASNGCRTCMGKALSVRLLKHHHNKTHGFSHSRFYDTWRGMCRRCDSGPENPDYKYYGEKGIKVCARWRNSIDAFYEDMGFPKKGDSIERLDNNKPYTKSNCVWIPKGHQRFNTSSTHRIKFEGVTRPLSHWARIVGVCKATMMWRFRRWGIRRAITTPVNLKQQQISRATIRRKNASHFLITKALERWKTTPRVSLTSSAFPP